jgi:hypothetical protein
MSNKNASVIMKDILLVPNNPLDLIERLRKFIDISHIESKYLLEPNDLIKKKNIQKYLNRNFL